MSIATVVTRGYGSFGNVARIPTFGYESAVTSPPFYRPGSTSSADTHLASSISSDALLASSATSDSYHASAITADSLLPQEPTADTYHGRNDEQVQ